MPKFPKSEETLKREADEAAAQVHGQRDSEFKPILDLAERLYIQRMGSMASVRVLNEAIMAGAAKMCFMAARQFVQVAKTERSLYVHGKLSGVNSDEKPAS